MNTTVSDRRLNIKVLVLRGGGGHYATYRAIQNVLGKVRPHWRVEPLFADSLGEATDSQKAGKVSQVLSSGSDRFYDFILKNGFGWVHLITVHIHKLLTRMKHRLDVKLLRETWQQDPPDLVLSVVPFQNRALWESLQLDFSNVPVVSILTDFADSPPAYWMAPGTGNYVMCPTGKAVTQALAAGVRAERVVATSGLVIHPQFYWEPAVDISQKRIELGLDSDRMTGLVMFGANGSKVMLEIAQQLATFGDQLQLIFVCGRNQAVADALDAEKTGQKRAVVGFTDDIPGYMQLADFFIGKPGNVSVSEAIAMNLPTIVERNWLTLTQEKYAADWLEEHGVGLSVPGFKAIAPAVAKMIDPKTFAQYKANVKQLENHAVFELPGKLEEIVEEAGDSIRQTRPLLKSAVGLYEFSPQAIAHPQTEEALVEAVHYARQKGLRVRAIGAMHSAVPLPATEGLCIALDKYNKVLQVDGYSVTVQSGIRLWALNDFLADNGLALPVLGTIALQTVAGAISTGTHGGALSCTSLSGYVEAMQIVRSDGQVVRLQREDDAFDGAAIALGSLGLISTVTFRCVDAFSLRTEVCSMPMTSLLDSFDTLHRHNQYVDLRYSPITDQAHAALINPTPEPLTENGGWEPANTHPWLQSFTDWTNKLAQRLFLTHKFNRLQRWGISRYDRFIYTEAYGRSDFVLTHFDATSTDLLENEARSNLDPVADMEVAVPYHRAVEALKTLRHHFQQTRRFPSMHVHIRTQAAEPFWLSPTRGEAICWIEFWEYPCTGKFFAEMMALLAPFDPVGHWGKQLPKPPQEQYEKWDAFMALRQEWDPEGMFANDYLDRAFGFAIPQPRQPTRSATTKTSNP